MATTNIGAIRLDTNFSISNTAATTAVTSPLQLPEIIAQVGCYLSGSDLTAANLIEIELLILSTAIVQLLHQNAASLKCLTRYSSVHQPERRVGHYHQLFDAIESLVRLQHLRLEQLDVVLEDYYSFLTACQRLETLYLSHCNWIVPRNFASELPHLQQLTLNSNRLQSIDELRWIVGCPNLRFLRWRANSPFKDEQERALASKLMQERRLQFLRTLVIQSSGMDDEDIAVMILSLPALVNLHARRSEFGERATRAIVEVRTGMQELDIGDSISVTSEMIQAILSSCRHLETFGAGIFDIKDLPEIAGEAGEEERGWVCRRLQSLQISIMSSRGESTRLQDHKRMYEQLGKLTELRMLDLGTTGSVTRNTHDWIELSLANGFGQLAALSEMRDFTVGRLHRPLGLEEWAWVREHWPDAEVHGSVA
ncbi:hypothetical protein BGZ98_000736 [Dissophora globulifera]|nr:hypothetical protein BGZ98_000736 [Dissophora globulifera]